MSSKPYCCKHDASVTDCDCACHDHDACNERYNKLQDRIGKITGWQHCELHGKINADHAWGCPDCVDVLRKENREFKRRIIDESLAHAETARILAAKDEELVLMKAEYDQEVISHDIEEKDLKAQITNMRSTIEAWNNPEIMKCGCKYNKVWGGTKWEHWLVPCKEHREKLS